MSDEFKFMGVQVSSTYYVHGDSEKPDGFSIQLYGLGLNMFTDAEIMIKMLQILSEHGVSVTDIDPSRCVGFRCSYELGILNKEAFVIAKMVF